jgi:glycosyltransferase involved in cell wall biosynthesis
METERVVVLSFSRIARDRRVQRQCAALADRNELALVLGYADDQDSIPYPFKNYASPTPSLSHRLSTVARQLPAWFGTWAAKRGFWLARRHRWALDGLKDAAPTRIVANDWPALVVAAAYKRLKPGVRIHYDTHEFAALEFDENLWWRIVYKPFVQRLEAAHISAADMISTVGVRLAEALQKHHHLPRAPVVIRNIPDSIPLEGHPAAWPLRLLYHGQVLPDRGLEALIDSIPLWNFAHQLTIRGDGPKGYVTSLQSRVASHPCSDRLIFEQAVPPDQVMPLAAVGADIGVHVTPLDTLQRHFSMPNKLFEYIGAGLAVLVSPAADMRALVEAHGVGLVSTDAGPQAIAAALNSLDLASVERFRAAARKAAKELCWEVERDVFNALHDRLVKSAPMAARVDDPSRKDSRDAQ